MSRTTSATPKHHVADLPWRRLRGLHTGLPIVRRVVRRGTKGLQRRLLDPNTREFVSAIEDALRYFNTVEEMFEGRSRLESAIVLVRRLRGDFESALIALAFGTWKVAYDLMRDALEIEFLLRDFAHEPGRLRAWQSSDDGERWAKFRPAVLRKRAAARLKVPVDKLQDVEDYRSHSSMLHVSPFEFPAVGWGLSNATDKASAHLCFWDAVEHAWRCVLCLHQLMCVVGRIANQDLDPRRVLKKLSQVRRACRTAQWITLAATTAPPKRIPPLEVMTGEPVL